MNHKSVMAIIAQRRDDNMMKFQPMSSEENIMRRGTFQNKISLVRNQIDKSERLCLPELSLPSLLLFLLIGGGGVAALGLCCCLWASSSCGEQGYSSLWCTGFSLWQLLSLQSIGSRTCGLQQLQRGAQLLLGMWHLPRLGIEPTSCALLGGLLTAGPPEKSYLPSLS